MTRAGAARRLCTAALAVAWASAARAQTHVLIVTGLGGEPKFSQRFADLAGRLSASLHDRYRLPDENITWLGEDSTCTDRHYRGKSTRENVEKAAATLATRVKPGEQVVIVLIGHGAGDGGESRLNLPGPDLTAADYQRILGKFAQQRVAFLALMSASGDMLPVVSAAGRVTITATKTAYERNESRFAEFFVDALTKDGADTDKDARVSLLEAYAYAVRETKRLYDDAQKLQTEHSQLEDQGNKAGEAAPTGRGGEGMVARRFFLDANGAAGRAASTDPRLNALYDEKFALEDQLEMLRPKKTSMTAAAYEAELEKILVMLARKAREIRTMEGR